MPIEGLLKAKVSDIHYQGVVLPHLLERADRVITPSRYLAEVGIPFERFMDLGRHAPGDPREPLCTTFVGLRMADNSVGVSRLHGSVSRRLWKDAWPGLPEEQVPIGSVTNGAHMPSWVAPELADLLRRHVAWDWWDLDATDPRWDGIDNVPDEELWEIHCGLKTRRYDVGGNVQWLLGRRYVLAGRFAASDQEHRHQFGEDIERDRTGGSLSEVVVEDRPVRRVLARRLIGGKRCIRIRVAADAVSGVDPVGCLDAGPGHATPSR